ncbi:MAG: phospho-N-acetylmuramoyl-pentapeptide-transferase [Flavobacteriales bacterium]|nr:phospho-N-acetylmuramoyl-pentapeptide-transferase [Flavobacteriales bacterium]
MLYYLFEYLHQLKIPGTGVFQYISFRAGMAVILSLIISAVLGGRIIQYLRKKQVGETVRDLGLEGQLSKQGTPTMGGLIILAAILIPTLLFARLDNIYIILMIISTISLGMIGFLDDYIKIFKKNKKGLAGKFKIIGQVGIGLIVGVTLYFHEDVKIRKFDKPATEITVTETAKHTDYHSTQTTLPFIKNHEFDYSKLLGFMGDDAKKYAWLIFIPVVILVITAVSNGANMTDGLDGLATGTSAIIGVTLAVFAWVSGNTVFADYLNIMYIPNSGELVIYSAAFVGACTGFLWYNAYPAQVFMGDTGSLSLGGIIAVLAIAVRKELLLPILCGIFLIENLSVMLQVGYFKYTKRKYGEGKRIFRMAPLHHHYQKGNIHEAKIVARFWIIGLTLAVLTIITLKLR